MYIFTVGSDEEVCVITVGSDEEVCVITVGSDEEVCVITVGYIHDPSKTNLTCLRVGAVISLSTIITIDSDDVHFFITICAIGRRVGSFHQKLLKDCFHAFEIR